MSAAAQTLPASDRIQEAKQEKHVVHWFRKGLRLHDNPALREGIKNATTFRCVFSLDPWFADSASTGINKWRFLLQCLQDLDNNLKKLNSRLFVIRAQPADALPKLFREWNTTHMSFEEDPEPYGRVRDNIIISKCNEFNIKVVSRVSHTLYNLDEIIELNGGKAPLTYHQFQALIASMPAPLPAEPPITLDMLKGTFTPIADNHNERFRVPTLEELGFEVERLKSAVWVGGETEALARLERHLERKAWVATFGRPKMSPESLLASKTGLSPYLRFGCLSTRLFYSQLTELYIRVKKTRPPLSLHGQILWREFFYCAATRNTNFDHMSGNPICVQIPWEKNPEALAKWADGQTGFPWIDAIMIQLKEEGWIHHLARHAVACFLTRGDLWISWEEGMKVFEDLLLDADWSVNAGMWMWLSCSSFFQQFFHCYCPVRFGRKTDPNGDFIRKYIPKFKKFPTRYIHEPWMAPVSVQETAECIIGKDYPVPIVDHAKASQINLERIKQVYAQLAKYKPQSSLNPNTVQRPNMLQSSPSPTSIIASINQSNYLCSQTSDSQSTPQQIINENFRHPGKTREDDNSTKQAKFKQVVIIQQSENANVVTENTDCSMESPSSRETYVNGKVDAIYKNNSNISKVELATNQDNYNFKNLTIDNCEKYSNRQDIYQNQQVHRIELLTQQGLKINNFIEGKPKLYLTTIADDDMLLETAPAATPHNFIVPLSRNYREAKCKNGKTSLDGSLNKINLHTEQKFESKSDKKKSDCNLASTVVDKK